MKTNDLDVASSFLLFFLFQLKKRRLSILFDKKFPFFHFKPFLFYSFLIVCVRAAEFI